MIAQCGRPETQKNSKINETGEFLPFWSIVGRKMMIIYYIRMK